jgi:hypothetical protein
MPQNQSKTVFAGKTRRILARKPVAGANDSIYNETIGGENFDSFIR